MMLIMLLTQILIQETIDKLVDHLPNQIHQITIVMANHGATEIDHIGILVALEAVEEDPQIEIKVMMTKKMGPPTLEALEEVVEVPLMTQEMEVMMTENLKTLRDFCNILIGLRMVDITMQNHLILMLK
jgi:hypothetical protein